MIDWQRTLQLRDEVGAEDFDEIVELFLSEVEDALDRLDAAGTDTAQIEAEMHFLKGAALNLGFQALASLCADGETAAASGQQPAFPIADVRKTYEASKTELQADLPARAA